MVQADAVEVEASRPDFDYDVKPGFTKVPEPDFKPGQGLNKLVCLPTLNKCTELMIGCSQGLSTRWKV
jgi:hypothetical protein